MKRTLNMIPTKWKLNGISVIGGTLLGAGIADCLFAINQLNLDQIARGLTIFSAGLTIMVLIDNAKTQKDTEKVQKDTQLQLEKVEVILNTIHQSQQMNDKQLHDIKELLHKSNSIQNHGDERE